MLPAPSNPSAPELLTALAKRHPLVHIIPACTIGYLILKRWVIRFENMICQFANYEPKSISVLSPMLRDRVSPLISVSLPISESSRTTSYNFEKDPMIEAFTME